MAAVRVRFAGMAGQTFMVTEELWLHDGPGGWHFITLPPDVTDDIRAGVGGAPRPFGAVAAQLTIARTTWSTSLFADTRRQAYLLPVKADVRRAERLEDGDRVTVTISLGS